MSDCCCEAPKLVFPCGGAADVGALSVQVARQLTKEGTGKMYCLTGVGGRVEEIMENTRLANKVLAIDGCEHQCAKHCLELAGIDHFDYILLTDLGFKKGGSPVNSSNVEIVALRARPLLGNA